MRKLTKKEKRKLFLWLFQKVIAVTSFLTILIASSYGNDYTFVPVVILPCLYLLITNKVWITL